MDLIDREQALGCFWAYEDGDETNMPAYDRLQALPVVAEVEDCISRRAAIDGIEQFRPIEPKYGETSMEAVNRSAWDCAINCVETFIRTMPPSAQPDVTDTNVGDCISRQAAIQVLDNAAEQWNIAEPYHEGMRAGFRNSARLILSLPSAQPEVKEIGYAECADAMLKMWMDNVVTDGEYNRIMDKLNKYWGKVNA